jgi:DNA processing protein
LVPPLCARGLTIVSGLAQGIDAEAHAAALGAGGRTLAVLGQGLDTPLYPSSNRSLANRIVQEDLGAILSIFPLATTPQPQLYPQRNEVLAALALGVLVVEADRRSGTLITARHAADFGKTVMACPGDADRATAEGSNRLLTEGAALIQSSDDILEALAPDIRSALHESGLEFGRRRPDPGRPETPGRTAGRRWRARRLQGRMVRAERSA